MAKGTWPRTGLFLYLVIDVSEIGALLSFDDTQPVPLYESDLTRILTDVFPNRFCAHKSLLVVSHASLDHKKPGDYSVGHLAYSLIIHACLFYLRVKVKGYISRILTKLNLGLKPL